MGTSYIQVVLKISEQVRIYFISSSNDSILLSITRLVEISNEFSGCLIDIYPVDFSADEAIAAIKALDLVGNIGKYTIHSMFVEQVNEQLIGEYINRYNKNEISAGDIFDFWWDGTWTCSN